MKKFYTLLLTLACSLSCVAAPLSPQEALQRVAQSKSGSERALGSSGTPQLVMTGKAKDGALAYYVFTDASKTLFLSADDVAIPLLGYSDKGNFDPATMSPELKWWLETYAEEIEYAVKNNKYVLGSSDSADKQVHVNGGAIAPLLSTTWDQGTPYNNYCPVKSGERTVTGCVATSMSQVMNYYKWPETQVASISYEWNGQTLTSPATVIDWSNMRNSYQYNYTDAQAQAVARLMQLAGYSVKMQYDIAANGGSGAFSVDVRGALVEKFGYDIGTDYILRDYYSTDEWAQKIYDNLANIGPVIYNGRGTNGGHSFVCDGYDGNGKFHMNWGWSGVSDGYFVLSALNPSALGTGGGSGGFNIGQGAVIGIRKPQQGSVAPQPVMGCDADLYGTLSGRTLTLKSDNSYFYNISPVGGTITLGVRMTNKDNGEVLEYATAYSDDLMPGYGWATYNLNVPSTLPHGTYEVRSTYRVGSGDWQLTRFVDGAVDRFNLTSSEAGLALDSETPGEISFVSYDYHDGFKVSGDYQVDVTLKSTYSTEKNYTLGASLCTLQGNTLHPAENLGSKTVAIPANSEKTVSYTGTLSADLEPGTYYLAFIDDAGLVGYTSVEVREAEEEDEGEIALYSYRIDMPFKTGQDYGVVATVKNTFNHEESFSLDARLCTLSDGYMHNACFLGSSTITVPANSQASMSFTGTLDQDFTPGEYYLCFIQGTKILYYTPVEVTDGSGEITIIGNEVPEEFKTSEPYYFSVTVESTYDHEEDYTLEAKICSIIDNAYQVVCDLGRTTVLVPANSEATLEFSGILDDAITPGTYYLTIRQGGMIVQSIEIEVVEGDDGSGEIYLTEYNSSTGFITGEEYEFYVKAQSTYKHDEELSLEALLCDYDGNDLIPILRLGSMTQTVPAQSEVTFNYTGTLNMSIEPGTYYVVFHQNYLILDLVEVEVTSNGTINCRGFYLDPEIVTTGETSVVNTDVYSSYSVEKTFDMSLYLCTYDSENGYIIKHQYGTVEETFDPEEEKTVTFSSTIPEDLEESDNYYLVLCCPGNYILDKMKVNMHFTTGIQNVGAETSTKYRYFNMNGIEVKGDNLAPGLYIRHSEKESTKILIK